MKTLNFGGRIISFDVPMVMGILNVTPDSFFDGGKYNVPDMAKQRIETMIEDGADFIDIGAASSRPGAGLLDSVEEWRRLEPVLKFVKNYQSVVFSVDTTSSEVARKCVEFYGISMINDISCGELDSNMFRTVADLKVPFVAMHMRGTPENMNDHIHYNDLIPDILNFFLKKISDLGNHGIFDVILDPGFGFSKTVEQNFQLLNHMNHFSIIEKPILAGISRKSMIYKTLKNTPAECLNGTTILNTIALCNGADIIRVHDVKEAVEAVALMQKTRSK